VDSEQQAASAIHRRATRIRVVVGVTGMFVGMGIGLLGYLGLRRILLDRIGFHSPYLTALVAMMPPITITVRLATRFSRKLIVELLPSWIEEQARIYGVDPRLLEEHASVERGTPSSRA
jgi:hypothetical protein